MGLGDFILRQIVSNVAMNAAKTAYNGATKGMEYISEKREEHYKKKCFKILQKSFSISFDKDEKTIDGRIKSRNYHVKENSDLKYQIKRTPKSDGTSLLEIYEGTTRDASFTINEIKDTRGGSSFFIKDSNKDDCARVLSSLIGPYRFFAANNRINWDIFKQDGDYVISSSGNTIAVCKLQGFKVNNPKLSVSYIEDMPMTIIMLISLCIMSFSDMSSR